MQRRQFHGEHDGGWLDCSGEYYGRLFRVTKSATLTVNPAASGAFCSDIESNNVVAGQTPVGTVTLTKAAPTGGLVVTLTSNKPTKAIVPQASPSGGR